MRIYNKMANSGFFRYAGRGIRGVELKPRQESPELTVDRFYDVGVQKDLRLGNIGVIVTADERASLGGLVSEDLLCRCDVGAPSSATVATISNVIPFDQPPIPVIPEPESPPAEPKTVVIERGAVTPKVDPVRQEIERVVSQTAAPEKEAQLKRFEQSENPAVAKTAAQVAAEWTSCEDADDPATPGAPGLDTSKYKGLPKHALYSECLRRGINDVNPGGKIKELRRRLAENDKLTTVGR